MGVALNWAALDGGSKRGTQFRSRSKARLRALELLHMIRERLGLFRRILAAVFVFAASVSHASTRTYAEKIEGIPYPTDQADWRKKCAWLRREIAREQNIASSGTTQPGTFSYETQAIARNKVATLDSRMSDFHCNAGYISLAPPLPAKSKIERCIEACKANTHRTPEKCLEACNDR